MLRIPSIEEIRAHLLEVPRLTDVFAAGDAAFLDCVLRWFKEVELVLLRNRLLIAAEVAAMRGAILSAKRGYAEGHAGRLTGKGRRRAAEAVAEQMTRSAVELIGKRIDRDVVLISKAEEAAYELVIVGRQLNILPIDAVARIEAEDLNSLWERLSADKISRKHTIYIRTLVGKGDALILLDRALGR